MDLIKNGRVSDGMVVVTDNQTKGRGQHGNSWEAEPGLNLTFSVVYETSYIKIQNQFDLNLAVSVALQQSISKYLENVSIKWPNDILAGGKKVCGILIENSVRGQYLNYSVIGIGININQLQFENQFATSFQSLTGIEYDLNDVLAQVLSVLEMYLSKLKDENEKTFILNLYTKYLFQRGVNASYKSEKLTSGVILGVDNDGRLIIDSQGILYYFNNKEVKFLL